MVIPHEEIKKERLKKNISQVEMAEAAGMSRSAYITFEKKGSENLPLKSAVGIANKLDKPFIDLFQIGDSAPDGAINELHQKIKDLKIRLKEKDIIIESLENRIRTNATKLIERIEEKGTNAVYWGTLQRLQYATTEEEIAEEKKILEIVKKQREGIFDFYLKEGIITNEDIQRTQATIQKRYSKIFEQVQGKPASEKTDNNSTK
jgi:transcriptional regulator with XRE-family HTH domain